jgi:hypothetical protein
MINELPEEIQGGLNELISYIIKRNKWLNTFKTFQNIFRTL